MPKVAALYRYPLKGFTPESRESLQVLADGRVAGDRVLGLRYADNEAGDDEWSPKTGMLVLMTTPGLARLNVRYDEAARRLRVEHDGALLVEDGIDGEGRQRIAEAVEAFAATLEPSPLAEARHRPLRLVGDGCTPRFQDRNQGILSMHGRGSLRALGAELDERRFRSNVAIEGTEAWEELGWQGRRLRIGAMEFRVTAGLVRCLATHANPRSGVRDFDMMNTLTSLNGIEKPTFAVSIEARGPGTINVGDEVQVLED